MRGSTRSGIFAGRVSRPRPHGAHPAAQTAADRKDPIMSLAVSPDLLDQARHGEVDDAAFADCIRTSLPYAWQLISRLIQDLHTSGGEFADNQVPPPDETARGQLLRMMASDAMRGAIERHYRVRLAFQNCHRVAVFRPEADQARADFTTARSQILNQRPDLVDC
jgi:hypothetical protein